MSENGLDEKIIEVADLALHLMQAIVEKFDFEFKEQDKDKISKDYLKLCCEGLKCFNFKSAPAFISYVLPRE